MRALIVLVVLCLSGAGLGIKLRCGAEEGILLSVLGMIAAAYAAALAGNLPFFGVLPRAEGLAGAVILAISIVRRLVDWDDFSHWGYALKVMFCTDGLYTAPGYGDGFASYPPASTLWQYLTLHAAGAGYREDIALWANTLLSAALLLAAV